MKEQVLYCEKSNKLLILLVEAGKVKFGQKVQLTLYKDKKVIYTFPTKLIYLGIL